jgi:hypothetical protein
MSITELTFKYTDPYEGKRMRASDRVVSKGLNGYLKKLNELYDKFKIESQKEVNGTITYQRFFWNTNQEIMIFYNPTYYEMYGRGVHHGRYKALLHILDELNDKPNVPSRTKETINGIIDYLETCKKLIFGLSQKQMDYLVQTADKFDIDITDFYLYEEQNPIFKIIHKE